MNSQFEADKNHRNALITHGEAAGGSGSTGVQEGGDGDEQHQGYKSYVGVEHG